MSIFQSWTQTWRQLRGEQYLTTTMWGRDYPVGTNVWNNDQCYQITRYVRAADKRSLEVWGKLISAPAVEAEQPERRVVLRSAPSTTTR